MKLSAGGQEELGFVTDLRCREQHRSPQHRAMICHLSVNVSSTDGQRCQKMLKASSTGLPLFQLLSQALLDTTDKGSLRNVLAFMHGYFNISGSSRLQSQCTKSSAPLGEILSTECSIAHEHSTCVHDRDKEEAGRIPEG